MFDNVGVSFQDKKGTDFAKIKQVMIEIQLVNVS